MAHAAAPVHSFQDPSLFGNILHNFICQFHSIIVEKRGWKLVDNRLASINRLHIVAQVLVLDPFEITSDRLAN